MMPAGSDNLSIDNHLPQMKRDILIVLLTVFHALNAAAAFMAPELNFTHYTTENGLPSNNIRDIIQDSDGFMWFATDGGLVRLDGSSCKVFVPRREDGNSDFFMMSLCNTPEGLLVGSDHCLYRFDSLHEKLEEMKLQYAPHVKERISGMIDDICTDSTGDIWVAVDERGVFRISSEGVVIGHQAFPETSNYIGMLYVDPSDIVWGLSTNSDKVIYKYDRATSSFEKFQITVKGSPVIFSAMAMTCDSYGDYWLGTWESGIIRFDGRTGEGEWILDAGKADKVWHIHSLTEYSPTMLLVGSDSGLALVERNTGEFKVYDSDELNQQSLTDRFIYPITKDSDGGFWIGTYYRGVNYLRPDFRRFQRWYHSRFANSVCGNVISRFCEDNSGNIWIGSADGGLCRYNPVTGAFTQFPLVDRNQNENVNALQIDGNRLWVGTYTQGAGILDIKTGKWQRIPVGDDYYYSSYAILKDSKGRIWMASTGTLTKFNPDKHIFEKTGNFGAWIIDIDEDKDGSLWLSTMGNGLFKVDPETGTQVNFSVSSEPGSLPHNHISGVTVGEDGEVYVATIYGVYRYLPDSSSFEEVTKGLQNVSAQSVQQTGSELWISTLSGLLHIKGDGESRMFTYADGLSDNQFLPGASMKASDGKIYYGTVHGFCRVDPMAARNRAEAPRLTFTRLEIVNNPIEVGDSHLPESLNNIEELLLTHADHTFTIYFSALNYSNPEGNIYKYRLEGFDKSWHTTGKENRATYSNLPPGSYTLWVKGANSDGIWNDEGISLKIVVKPAWYATALMKVLYVLIGAALLLLGVRYVLWRLERNHKTELDRISSNKEKEMFRSKLSFFTVVAHEIRTPVSLIIGPLEKILNSSENFSSAVKDDLFMIDRNARRLLSLVNQLLDYKKVEDNALPVGFRKESVTPLLENVTDRFRPSLEHKGIKLEVEVPDESVTADIDPEAFTKLVSNLLNNARKFTKDEIKVEYHADAVSDMLVLKVEDNGIGIGKENRDKIFKPFFQVLDNVNDAKGGTGLGLSIVKSVVDAHGGKIEVDSIPGKGSKFIVYLPLHQKNVMPAESTADTDIETDEIFDAPGSEESGKPTLLVVDDNEEMVSFIASSFERHYEIVTASNGKEALEKLAKNKVSMIICDWMMPVMDGVELLKKVRENEAYSHIPFVMLTAKTDNVSKIETMRQGADLYIEKPFSTGYLEACIASLLDMRALLKKKFSESPLEPITTLAVTDLDNEFLSKIQNLIEENFSNPDLTVDFLADHLGISRSGFYTKIKTLVDVTPKELIQITRLKKAAALLCEGKYRINEISYMVGFNSSSYFSKCFHKQFGMTPGEFSEGGKGNFDSSTL